MKVFKDNKGRTWTIEINIATVRRVRSMLTVNLLEAVSGKLIERLQSDVILCVDIIYVLCKKEADALGVGDEDFGTALAGDALNDAVDAFLEELADFFPAGERAALRKTILKFNAVKTKALALVGTYIDSDELTRKIDDSLKSITGSSGSSPESSESTPQI